MLGITKHDELKHGFDGEVLFPGGKDYEAARRIWNAMIDRRPALIVRCATSADVVRALQLARKRQLPLAIRSGGHNIAGSAMCDDGIVIDLSLLRIARVDAKAQRAIVQGGAMLADLDAATQRHGLATPLGINSTTGVAGLTLGGGFGWLSRKYGMTVDNLETAEVVLANGKIVQASAVDHPDLFWAIRGGGGNFGVVTRLEFRLHAVGPGVLSGLIVYPMSEAKAVLQQYREFVAASPDELTVWAILRQAPPLPFLPASAHGHGMIALAILYAGEPDAGERLIDPLRHFGTPLGEHVGVQPYITWQQAFDPLLTHGARNYWKSHNLSTIEDGLIDAVIDCVDKLPSPQCEIFFAALGGATMRPAPEETAYPHRDARYVMNVHGRWMDSADDQRCTDWARTFFKASARFTTGGVYVNFMSADEQQRVRAAYGPNYDRLVEVKRAYDPDNLFCVNQNINPGTNDRGSDF